MAFSRTGLSRTSSSGNTSAPQSWNYTTLDAYSLVDDADYFLDAIREIHINDNITVASSTGTTAVVTQTYMAANDGTTCTIAAGVTVTA